MPRLNINGKTRNIDVEPDTPLLWVIREQVGLTGTKYGCGVAQCGACSVHINGEVQRSCPLRGQRREAVRPHRDHRGPVRQPLAPGAEGVGRARRAAMRLLPVRPDHGGRRAAGEDREADRQGHRRGDDQHLPLRHLSAHPRGRAHGGRQARRRQDRHRVPARRREEGSHDEDHSQQGRRNLPAASSSSAPPPRAAGSRSASNLPFGGTRAVAQGAAQPAPRSTRGSSSSPTTPASSASRAPRWGRARSPASRSSSPRSSSATGRRSTTESITAGQNLARKRVWGDMATGGSRGIRGSQDYVRRGGAAARMMLLQAAADEWKVPVGELTVANGVITHAASNRTTTLRQGRGGSGEGRAARSRRPSSSRTRRTGRSPASR